MSIRARFLASFLVFNLLISVVSAQQLDPRLYQELRWRLVGPFRGGRTVSVAGIPGNPNVYYFGAVGGGIWKTTNAGVTWNPIFDLQSVASIGAIALAPSDPNTIYVGTGEPDLRSDLSPGNGMYKSTDAGVTWQHIGLDDSRQIARIVVDPHDPNIVLVAVLGHAYGPNPERGVFKSIDGGKTWKKVLFRDATLGAIDLTADPDDARVLYAGMWHVQRPPWSQYPPDNSDGTIYRSTDEGETWKALDGQGLPLTTDGSSKGRSETALQERFSSHSGLWGRVGIRVAAGTHGKRLYALIDHKDAKQAGFYRSDDGGATWSRVGTDSRILGRLWYFGEIAIDPKNADVVYLPNVSLYRSQDAGKGWEAIKGAPGGDDYHALWIDPTNPQRMTTGSDQGATISVDGGKSWSSWYNQPTAQLYHVITDNDFPYHIYGSQQDSGTVSIASRSDYGSITFRNWYSIGAGESGYIAPNSDGSTVYGGDPYGPVYRFDRRTGQSQNVSPLPVQSFGSDINERKLRATWTSPIVISPRDPNTLYFGSQYLLRSNDHGLSWQQISSDLTGAKPCDFTFPIAQGTYHLCKGWGVIYTVAPSPLDENVIWTGSDTGLIYLTRDGGKTWNDVTPPKLEEWSKISLIEAGHFDAGTAYAAVDRHRLDDTAPYIYGTHDYGKSWKQMIGCLPPNECWPDRIGRKGLYDVNILPSGSVPNGYARAVREDPIRKGLLFAGTERGVYFSVDDGNSWNPLQLNLPATPIHDLVIKNNDLIVATHGRSFWVLDDLSPLRALSNVLGREPEHLFKPASAVRVRKSVNNDTPLPPEEPQGDNPPAGAVIDYWISPNSSREVLLDLIDQSGQIVRHYSSNDRPRTPRVPPPFPNYWLPKPEILSAEPGMHRFVWDLRYAPPAAGGGYAMAVANRQTEPQPQGPLVVPGSYRVRLTVDGKSYEQPLEVGPDPRVKASAQEYAHQFALAKRIYDSLQQAEQAIRQIDQRRVELKQQPNPELDRKLLAIAGAARGEEDEDATNAAGSITLRRVSSALSHLLGVVESADAPPTEQAAGAAGENLKQLEALLTQAKALSTQ